jgi:hypothetical protein
VIPLRLLTDDAESPPVGTGDEAIGEGTVVSNATIWVMLILAVVTVLLATRPERPTRSRRDRRTGEHDGGGDDLGPTSQPVAVPVWTRPRE